MHGLDPPSMSRGPLRTPCGPPSYAARVLISQHHIASAHHIVSSTKSKPRVVSMWALLCRPYMSPTVSALLWRSALGRLTLFSVQFKSLFKQTDKQTDNRAARDTIKREARAPATTNRRHHTRCLTRAVPYGPPNTQSQQTHHRERPRLVTARCLRAGAAASVPPHNLLSVAQPSCYTLTPAGAPASPPPPP